MSHIGTRFDDVIQLRDRVPQLVRVPVRFRARGSHLEAPARQTNEFHPDGKKLKPKSPELWGAEQFTILRKAELRDNKDNPRYYYPNTDDGRSAYITDATAAINEPTYLAPK